MFTKRAVFWVPYDRLSKLLDDLDTLSGVDLHIDMSHEYSVRVKLTRWQTKRLLSKVPSRTLEEVYGR